MCCLILHSVAHSNLPGWCLCHGVCILRQDSETRTIHLQSFSALRLATSLCASVRSISLLSCKVVILCMNCMEFKCVRCREWLNAANLIAHVFEWTEGQGMGPEVFVLTSKLSMRMWMIEWWVRRREHRLAHYTLHCLIHLIIPFTTITRLVNYSISDPILSCSTYAEPCYSTLACFSGECCCGFFSLSLWRAAEPSQKWREIYESVHFNFTPICRLSILISKSGHYLHSNSSEIESQIGKIGLCSPKIHNSRADIILLTLF